MGLIATLLPQPPQFAVSAHCQSTLDAADPTALAAEALADSSDASFLTASDHFHTVDSYWATCEFSNMPLALAIQTVSIRWRGCCGGGGGGLAPGETNYTHAYVELGGIRYYAPAIAEVDGFPPPVTEHTFAWPANPQTLAAWTQAAVNAARFGVEGYSVGYPVFATPPLIAQARVDVSYLPAPATIDIPRDIGSRRIWLRRRPPGKVTVRGRADLLSLQPGSRIELEHIAGIHATGNGWEDQPDKKRPLWVESNTWNPDDMTVTLMCIDQRRKMCLLYESGSATVAGVAKDGLMRMSPGAIWTMSRASTAEFMDATGQLVSVPNDVEALGSRGQIFESAGGNGILNSAFANGVDSSWTSSGEGSNGSNITENTFEGLWTRDLTIRCLEIQAGSPVHAADLQHAAAAVTGIRGSYTASIYHKDILGPTSVAMQRSIDSKWYRNSDQTWQVAKTWNALTQRAGWDRDHVASMDVGGSPTDVTLYVGIPTATAIAAQRNLVAHVQLRAGKFPMSPIFTLGAAGGRAADDLRVTNNLASRTLSAQQFTLMIEAEPFWSWSDLTGGGIPDVKPIEYIEHDANNWLSLEYLQVDGSFTIRMNRAGVLTTAKCFVVAAAGTRYVIAVRFIGSHGELGLAPYTLLISVNGVAGTITGVAAGPLVEQTLGSFIRFGGAPSGFYFDGIIRQRFSSPQVLTDAEIAGGI